MNNDATIHKQQLRQKALAARQGMKRSEKQMLDFKIADRVLGLWKFRESPCLLFYCSTALEVDTRRLIERAWALGKTVALPRCRPEPVGRVFFVIHAWDDVEPGMLDIPEPKAHCRPLPEDMTTLCIVPGLMFDRAGHRIGYGKGYYDRFLSVYRGAAVGLVYERCMEEELPYERHDRTVDIIVTENDTYFCKN